MAIVSLRRARPSLAACCTGVLASGLVGVLAYRRGALSRSGVVGAVLTGTTIFAGGGALPATLLVTFFGSSSALSHWQRGRKQMVAAEVVKGERRDLAQTLANGGVAALLVASGRIAPTTPWFPALVGTLATVNADTWATEIGLLSRQVPRLVTTGRVVAPGTSGAISPLGTGAAALGAACIGVVAVTGGRFQGDQWPWRGAMLPLSLLAGMGGALADSLLGATIQARHYCPVCEAKTERPLHRCGTRTIQVGGWRWVDNDVVNGAASLVGALLGWGWGATTVCRRARPQL